MSAYGALAFTSPLFLLFLLGALGATAVFPLRHRWVPLLTASYLFYASWGVGYLLAVLGSLTVATWACGLTLERDERRQGVALAAGIAVALGALVGLRYVPFLADNTNRLLEVGGLRTRVPVPEALSSLGVSYYTLQAISYLVDVRYGVVGAERHLGRFALHLSFFPKLLQGPIERAPGLLPQLSGRVQVRGVDLRAGTQLILWGLFQKIVVADRLAPFVASVYGDLRGHSALSILLATYFFSAQLYFDFAGYTDMALGAARLFGIRLTQNFDSPYLARSVAEFWRRWHISLSTWLLDYVFRPLQLSLRDWRTWGTPAALVLTFLASGVWHGASWGFVAWGLLHGVYLGTSILYRRPQGKLHRLLGLKESLLLAPLQVAVTFHLVCFSWVFFRAPSLDGAVWAAGRLIRGLPDALVRLARGGDVDSVVYLGQGRGAFVGAVALVVVGALLRSYLRRAGVTQERRERTTQPPLASTWVRAAVYAWMVYLIAFAGTSAQGFIYQRF